MTIIDISNLDKATVLQELYDSVVDPKDKLPRKIAVEYSMRLFALEEGEYFFIGPLKNKQLNISINKNKLDVTGFEKLHGVDTASKALDHLINPSTKLDFSKIINTSAIGDVKLGRAKL
jgi:hypothetical protein